MGVAVAWSGGVCVGGAGGIVCEKELSSGVKCDILFTIQAGWRVGGWREPPTLK